MMRKPLFHHLWSVIKNHYHQIFKLPDNPHLVGRSHTHIQKPYRRYFTAPDSVHQQLSNMLTGDQHFIDALKMCDGQSLIRVAIVSNHIHANLYAMKWFPKGPLWSVYNSTWRDDGVADFYTKIHLNSFESSDVRSTVEFFPLTRPFPTDLTYDFDEPYASYFRRLTQEEMEILSTTTRSFSLD
jgi:hypothetical protein